jgi:hypothetical protein
VGENYGDTEGNEEVATSDESSKKPAETMDVERNKMVLLRRLLKTWMKILNLKYSKNIIRPTKTAIARRPFTSQEIYDLPQKARDKTKLLRYWTPL